MNEHSMAHDVSFQGLTFCYTEHGTLLITLGGSHHRELNPRVLEPMVYWLLKLFGDAL